MKTISPVQSWIKGQSVEATILNAYCINDNLSNSATFYYTLLDDSLVMVSEGNLSMSGQDYADWQTNQYAYDYIATNLNLTIIGDYVPPVVEVAQVTE